MLGTRGLCVITIPASSYPYTITRFCLLLCYLRRESVRIGRHRASRLMRLMGLQAIKWANHVWCADLTYIWFRQFGLPSAWAGAFIGPMEKAWLSFANPFLDSRRWFERD